MTPSSPVSSRWLKRVPRPAAPRDYPELIARLDKICGATLGELAARHGVRLPADPLHAKGCAGELIELCLGASAGNRPEPDFPELGLELKTMPLNDKREPLESTFVCHAPLRGVRLQRFEESPLWHKLRQVLWVFVHAPRSLPLPERRILGYLFWRPDSAQEERLRLDYEELMERLALGEGASVTAREGEYLQLRPKAADGSALTEAVGPEGQPISICPRGFYLRRAFTATLAAAWRARSPAEGKTPDP